MTGPKPARQARSTSPYVQQTKLSPVDRHGVDLTTPSTSFNPRSPVQPVYLSRSQPPFHGTLAPHLSKPYADRPSGDPAPYGCVLTCKGTIVPIATFSRLVTPPSASKHGQVSSRHSLAFRATIEVGHLIVKRVPVYFSNTTSAAAPERF